MTLQFGCGFFCYDSPCETGYLFATFFVVYGSDGGLLDMQMVWSSNRDQMVQENAALTLTSKGELVLRNSDGALVWSTNTSTQAFQRMEMQESGNLVLYNIPGGIIWQSFDHHTDTLLRGQKFKVGQKLIANVSPKNTSRGRFYCTLLHDGIAMFTASAPAQMYYRYPEEPVDVELSYFQFNNQCNNYYSQGSLSPACYARTPSGTLYNKMGSDGILQACSVTETQGRYCVDFAPFFIKSVPECESPGACGDYGVCANAQCRCPEDGNAFKPIDVTKPSYGCAPRVALACSQTGRLRGHHFLELEHVAYFTYLYENSSTPGLVSREECKTLCLQNCSCKAAFFSCASVGAAIALLILLWAWINKSQKSRHRKEKDEDDDEEDQADWPEGLPVRYTFQELKDATNSFSMKLGSGGFGSVYEGVLADGSKIAVERLDGAGRGKREFRAEIETLGKVDHLNLVRLKGFCAEKAHRMLVYEHLPNGSLDKWIFSNNMHQHLLDWKTRKKIVVNIARGLTYLHEDCRDKIIHFDIKPQNILLDQNFNAKVSDFGLAKLVNREKSEVITMMRRTPGYMAPELLNMHFTEKADVFSFGVMVIEIVSGKRSRDISSHLFSMLKVKVEEGRLIDLVFPGLEDEEIGKEEAVKLLKVGTWCVQEDFTRRPAMSIVFKELEGSIDTLDDVRCTLPVSTVASYQQTPFSSELSLLSHGR